MLAAIVAVAVPTMYGAFVAFVDAALHAAPLLSTDMFIVVVPGIADAIKVTLQILQKDGMGYTVTIQLVVEV